jgi:hypothetical protein
MSAHIHHDSNILTLFIQLFFFFFLKKRLNHEALILFIGHVSMKHFSLSFLYSNIPLNIQKCVIITLKKKESKRRFYTQILILFLCA